MPPRRLQQKEDSLVRMLCYVLGVAPHEFGLLPDPAGWVGLKELLKALHEDPEWRHARESGLQQAAQRLAPDDLELQEGRMRCLSRTPPRPQPGQEPPAHLYLGVRQRAYPVLIKHGLLEAAGPHMLAVSQEDALRLGRRRDSDPILVTVQARQAADQGVAFLNWGQDWFVCPWAPPQCLMGPPVPEPAQLRRPASAQANQTNQVTPPPPHQMPGSFILTPEDTEKPYKRKGLKKQVEWKKERRLKQRWGWE